MNRTLNCFLNSLSLPDQLITIVDVGARWGANQPWDQVDQRLVHYIGFEPDKEECARLVEKHASPHIEYLPIALSNTNGERSLNLTREPGCSSMLKPNNAFMNQFIFSERWDVVKELTIPTARLSETLASKGTTPDLLKIDVQGAALEVLQGTGDLLKEILFVEVEVEFSAMYENQPLFADVDKHMRDHGFELLDLNKHFARRKSLDLNCSSRGQVLFADAIYVKSKDSFFKGKRLSKNPNRSIWQMLTILCVYGHFDLAISYATDRRANLSPTEKVLFETTVKKFTRIPSWRLLMFNNRIAEKLGFYLSVLGNSMQIKSRLFGWGCDLSAVDCRYKYLYHRSFLRFFRI